MLRLALMVMLLIPVVGAADTQIVQVGKGWRYRVFVENISEVDELSLGPDGSVYATQALGDGKGRVVRVRIGKLDVLLSDLDHPGGVLAKGRHLYVTEQISEGRVIRLNLSNGRQRVFAGLRSPEHLAALPDGDIVVTEGNLSGRLTRLSHNGTIEVIASGFNGVKGLSVARDGTIYVGERGTGRVLAYKAGSLNVVIDDLDAPGQIYCAADGAVWITENANPGRLLRFSDGVLETVLSGLSGPQGVVAAENGTVFVAERGQRRILVVEPKP